MTGTTHGYCSGNDDEDPVNYFYTEEYDIDKKFIEEYIDEYDKLDEDKLYDYNKINQKSCHGSGYCNTSVNHIAIEGKLIQKKNLKKIFLTN